jgi:ABC-type nickel/cobalt efflux system permease component RcnA
MMMVDPRTPIATFIRGSRAMRACSVRRAAACAALGFAWSAGLALSAVLFAPARADTVASLLGNFTINQYCGLKLIAGALNVHYVVVYGQLPALRELHDADANGDGITSQAERDAYVASLTAGFARALEVRVDGAPVPLRAVGWHTSLPTEQGGFSLRVDVDFSGSPAPSAANVRRLEFSNHNYAGRIGWNEIVVQAVGLAIFDTDAHSSSLTDGLNDALTRLPEAGPLDERSVSLRFSAGTAPAGATLIAPRAGLTAAAQPTGTAGTAGTPGTAAVPGPAGLSVPATIPAKQIGGSARAGAGAGSAGWESIWISQKTRELIEAISAPRLKPGVVILALLAAMLLGAVHALSPGHGKTVVGAYLIGSRGTPRHAMFLGLTVTATHTLGVFVLGFATLYASQFIVPERLFPILSLISALLVLVMGTLLLVQRVRPARPVFTPVATQPARSLIMQPSVSGREGGALMHSHGGPMHSHAPPGAAGEKITWRSLATLGISGGLVPCPSAMVLLLAAVALNKTGFGMVLVVAFSGGLAITLTAVGLLFLYARNRLPDSAGAARWKRVLPILSACAIVAVGVALSYGALKSFH